MGIFKKGDRAEIKSGVLKGTKGKIVNTNEKDKYGRSHVLQSDDGEIITPITDKELKKL